LYEYTDTLRCKVDIILNDRKSRYDINKGYAEITRTWEPGDSMIISYPMIIRRVIADKRVKDDSNLVALECGPLVYCFEGIDNNNQLDDLSLPESVVFNSEKRNGLLEGISVITCNVPGKNGHGILKLAAIPYYAWSNRGAGTMKIWLPQN
jgi:DUF1680 family protein